MNFNCAGISQSLGKSWLLRTPPAAIRRGRRLGGLEAEAGGREVKS